MDPRRVRLAIALWIGLIAPAASAGEAARRPAWQLGTPIVTYWCGPALTDAAAKQMADGGWNLVWCRTEAELDVAHRHGLRGLLEHPALNPVTLDTPAGREQLEGFLGRVRNHPALYAYFLTDEPGAAQFAAWGRLVAHLRERDPAHLAYVNLFPTYANNAQLGTAGDTVAAYREHLRLYVEQVRPALISYDHYQFALEGDRPDYFLNLAMIRRAALDAGVPFLNIVQASTWAPKIMRVPEPETMRYLVYTTLAYGGQGISYYIYTCADHLGGIAHADGAPTPLYHALAPLNREFVAIAHELQPLRSLGVYHLGMQPPGAVPLPADAPVRLDPPTSEMAYHPPERVRGVLIGLFGARQNATHALVVNLDYRAAATPTLVGAAGRLETLDATTRRWSKADGRRAPLRLLPGGGQLVRWTPGRPVSRRGSAKREARR